MAGKKKSLDAGAANMEKAANKFSKQQLATSERFRGRRDILEALLTDGELYTVKAVEEIMDRYMKGKVR